MIGYFKIDVATGIIIICMVNEFEYCHLFSCLNNIKIITKFVIDFPIKRIVIYNQTISYFNILQY